MPVTTEVAVPQASTTGGAGSSATVVGSAGGWLAQRLAVLLVAAIFLVANLVVDLLYALIDPRIRYR